MQKYFVLAAAAFASQAALAWEVSAELGVEQRYFLEEPTWGPDYQSNVSGYLQPEIYHAWNDKNDTFTFTPYVRVDERDEERTHGDVREFSWIHVSQNWELRSGVRVDFWGMTESQHLVDIINQTDAVENVDGEDKLGQPMINLSLIRDWGILDIYVLTGFRERTFPGENSRLGSPILVDTDEVVYEDSQEYKRVDAAIRWKQYFGPLDIAISHFSGTSRDPRLVAQLDGGFQPLYLFPVYDVIDQTGLEMQLILGGWALKFEGISRHGQCWDAPAAVLPGGEVEFCDSTYSAATAGFEYTQTGIFDSWIDVGWVMEGLYDDRGDEAPAGVNEHDVLLAQRWTLNDAASTEALLGVIYDYETGERAYSVEASRRFTDSLKASQEGRWFSRTGVYLPGAVVVDDEKLAPFADQDFVQLNIEYFF